MGHLLGKLLGILLVLGLAACTPDIAGGTYYCGPELLCPPELACDEPSYTCEMPVSAEAFSCPAGSQGTEPDESMEEARDLGATRCGEQLLSGFNGCLAGDADQADVFVFQNEGACSGQNPRLRIRLRFPVATAPLAIEVLDGNGQVVAEGEVCGNVSSGLDERCLELVPDVDTTYYLRVTFDSDGPDCDGQCGYNQYWLDVSYPLA